MDPVQNCPHATPDKLCISPVCNLSNPYICPQCEQAHEHNGTISAIRIGKVKEMCNSIVKNQDAVRVIRDEVKRVKEGIMGVIGEFQRKLEGYGEGFGGIGDELKVFVDGKGNNGFSSIWDKVKDKMKELQLNNQKQKEQELNEFRTKILEIVTPSNRKEGEQVQKIKQSPQDSSQHEFLQQFAKIFCFLNLEQKGKISSADKLLGLKPSSKPAMKITSKLFQICNEPELALGLYTKILAQKPTDIETITRKALLLQKSKKYQQAYDQLTLLIDLLEQKSNIKDPYYHLQRAEVCRMLGKFEEAEKQLTIYEKNGGKRSWKLEKQMGDIRQKQGNFQQAIKHYDKAQKSEDLDAHAIIQLYQSFYQCAQQIKNNPLALQCLTILIKTNPSNIDYIFKRATLYHQTKQHKKAAQDYTLALEYVKNIPGLYYNRAVQYLSCGEIQKVIPDLKKAIELDPKFKEAVGLLANTCFEVLKKTTEPEAAQQLRLQAIKSYQYLLSFSPSDENTWYNLGYLDIGKDNQKAYNSFSKVIEINPKASSAYLARAKCAVKLNKNRAECLRDIVTAINLGDRAVTTFMVKCALEFQLGLIEQALKTNALVLRADPQNAEAIELNKNLNLILQKSRQVQQVSVQQAINTQKKKQ